MRPPPDHIIFKLYSVQICVDECSFIVLKYVEGSHGYISNVGLIPWTSWVILNEFLKTHITKNDDFSRAIKTIIL